MSTPRTARRPLHYHRPLMRGPWLVALRRLWDRGYCDREIAETLTDLSSLAIATMECGGHWGWREVEKHLSPGAAGVHWTKRQVGYHRRQMLLPANPRRPQAETLAEVRRSKQHEYQRAAGWFHLLPRYDTEAKAWLAGDELRPREADILSFLRDNGAMTRRELAAAFRRQGHRAGGLSPLRSRRRYYLASLCRAGLIERDPATSHAFRLCGRAVAPVVPRLEMGSRRGNGMERLAARIGRPLSGPNNRPEEIFLGGDSLE